MPHCCCFRNKIADYYFFNISICQEKQHYIPEELGRDAQTVAALQRKHANFEQDLVTLDSQVKASTYNLL